MCYTIKNGAVSKEDIYCVGLDIAKNVFQVFLADKRSRGTLEIGFFQKLFDY